MREAKHKQTYYMLKPLKNRLLEECYCRDLKESELINKAVKFAFGSDEFWFMVDAIHPIKRDVIKIRGSF